MRILDPGRDSKTPKLQINKYSKITLLKKSDLNNTRYVIANVYIFSWCDVQKRISLY